MKKMVRWYSILKENDVEIKVPEYTEDEESAEEEAPAPEPVVEEVKPAKKAKAKKAD
jgi:hypothetical protein